MSLRPQKTCFRLKIFSGSDRRSDGHARYSFHGRGHGDGLHGHDDDRDHDDAHQGFPLPHHLLLPYCVFL